MFADDPQLVAATHQVSDLRILTRAELNQSVSRTDLTDLDQTEHQQINHWTPETVGQLLFNFWDCGPGPANRQAATGASCVGRPAPAQYDPRRTRRATGSHRRLPAPCPRCSLLGTGLAMRQRGPIPTLAIPLPLLFLGSQGLGNLPAVKDLAQYLPGQTGQVILHVAGIGDGPRLLRPYGARQGLAITTPSTLATLLAVANPNEQDRTVARLT